MGGTGCMRESYKEERREKNNERREEEWSVCCTAGLNSSSESHRCQSGRCTAPIWWRRGHCSWAWTQTPSSNAPWGRKERKEPARTSTRLNTRRCTPGSAAAEWVRLCVCVRGDYELTSKFIEIGGLAHFFLSLVGSSSISALIWDSFIPAMRLILPTGRWWKG